MNIKLRFLLLQRLIKKPRSIAVLDDFFPNLLTAFRVAEYNWYLDRFPHLTIYSTNPDFETAHAAYSTRYPQYANRVKRYDESSLDDCAFAYMVFLNNALCFLPDLIANHVPFIMTLYPGGGFGLNESESDSKLDMILASPLLKGIIATQSVTQVYLESRNCKVPVHKIYGVAISPIYFHDMVPRKRASSDSHVISICFVAERYMPKGVNKGYPQFIEAAQQLLRKFGNLRFSVVGSFDAEDILLDNDIRDSISFKGILVSADLRDFFFTQDIIISPNHPYMLHPGNFDGFPTASCVEASLCGVAVVCSDELKLNWCYSDWNDIVICNPTTQAIVKSVGKLIRNPDLFVNIGLRGQITSRNIFSPNAQLDKRVEVLKNYACSQGMDINFH